jgi:hypothetical protein
MATSITSLSIDAADAATLAAFWSEVLHRPVSPGATTESAAIDATDPASGPKLFFWKVPEPKSVKNRLHLDLWTDEFEAESKRLTDLGATPVADLEIAAIRWTTFADPEGNEFDLIASRPTEPAE